MILDVVQKSTHIDVSYTTEDGKIGIEPVPLPLDGYRNWVICGASDPERDPEFNNIFGEPVKRLRGARFYDMNLTEFLSKRLPKELSDKLHASHLPEFFSVDIETEILDEFPDAESAKSRILVFTITAPNMATMVLSLKDKEHEIDDMRISQLVNDAMSKVGWGQHLNPSGNWRWINQTFDNEADMINHFLDLMRTTLHYIGGWNFFDYDWKYITNRCAILGLDLARSSPEYQIDYEGFPVHRLIHDYMELYASGAHDLDFESLSLDAISKIELKVGKLDYGGLSLKELYEKDYSKYLAYAIVDTILVQLIHKKCARSDSTFAMAEYLRIGIKSSVGAIAQADALCFEEMYINKTVYGLRKEQVEKEPYSGGFVKQPVRKYSNYPVGYDAKALYPNTMRSLNLSFENYIGKASSIEEKELYLSKGYIVTNLMNIYKNDKDYLYKRIQEKLANQRGMFQGLQNEIYLDALTMIDNYAESIGVKLKHND